MHAECGKRGKVCVKMLQNWSRTRDAPLSLRHLSRTLSPVSLSLAVPSASTLCALCQQRRLRLRRQRRRCLYLFLFFYVYKISSLSVSGFRLYCGGCAAAEATATTMTMTTTAMTTPAITYMSWRYHLSGSIFNPRVTSNGRQAVPYDPHDPLPKYP